jgi:predicted amino acid-binding ACT domain protein
MSTHGDIETGGGGVVVVHLPPEPEMKGPLKPVSETTFAERLTGIIAAITTILALAAIIVGDGGVVVVAGTLSIIMGPYAYYQQTKLTDIRTLKETTAAVEEEVNRLKDENINLTKTVEDLGETIDELQDVGKALEVIQNTQGQSVSAFEKQVEENLEILAKMKQSTHGRVIQNLISVIYRGDLNQDNTISEVEAKQVIMGLKDVPGVTVHEERLRAAIVGKNIESIVDVVQNLLNKSVPAEDRIFEVNKIEGQVMEP